MNTKHIFLASIAFLALGCSGSSYSSNFASSTNTGAGETTPIPTQKIAQMAIVTENETPITSKDNYLNGHVSIQENGTSALNNLEADMKIKGRGNFTWTLDKKPYKMKFNSTTSVMGFPTEKEWVLLANHVDKTLVRTAVAFEFSRRTGIAYTPRIDYVDLTVNGQELGSYALTEQVKSGPNRVNITPLKATDISGEALTGGYLFELNERLDETVNWRTSRSTPYSLKEPSSAAPEQIQYIQNYVQTAEDVLYSANFADPVEGYAKYIDVDSFIQLYLVHELFKNKDAADFSSVYLYKERNQKLKMGPAWDFDLACGNSDIAEINNPEGWLLKTRSPWYRRLFEDPAFVAKVKAKWNEMKVAQIDTLDAYIDGAAYRVGLSQKKNFDIWQILDVASFPVLTPAGSYQGEVNFLKQWLKTRTAWMDQQIRAM
jgi:hypothetical protein